MRVEFTSGMTTPALGLVLAAALILAGRTAGGRDLAILAMYVWLASQE